MITKNSPKEKGEKERKETSMATYVALGQHKPLMCHETPTPWEQIKSMDNIQDSSFSELLGLKLHVGDIDDHVHNSSSSASSTPTSCFSSNSMFATATPERDKDVISTNHRHHRHSESFSSVNSESLSLCTEGLGLESSDDMEDCCLNDLCNNECQEERMKNSPRWGEPKKRAKTSLRDFPPPISCIGKNGKPWVCFKSYRENGRFILKEIRIPTQEFLHAWREYGRLRLRFVHSSDDDEVFEDDDHGDGDEKELD